MILDDHRAILDVVTEALIYEQFDVLDTALGSQLFDAVREFSPDLLLLDYRLAVTNGGDLCRRLKDTPEYRHIHVVIFSAYFTPGDAARPGGCDGILYKPFDLEALLSTVYGFLEKADAAKLSITSKETRSHLPNQPRRAAGSHI